VDESQEAQSRPDWVMAWDELTPEQQAARARDMEVYAGMVDYLALGGQGAAFFENFDNSPDNKGLPGSSTDIGPGWAYAAATPFRLFKGYVAQGGIQVPAIVKLPGSMRNAGDRIDQVAHVMDLMPTFLSVAGADYPADYKGESIVPLAGESLLPMLNLESAPDNLPRELGWSAYGMDAYRQGNWKALRLPEPFGNGDWQLYDLASDPGEINDLAAKYPERVDMMAKAWAAYATLNGVIQPDAPTFYAKPVVGRKY
jgi:arylsulfatase